MAKQWAKDNNIEIVEYLPDYSKYQRAAPIKRNTLIVEEADVVIAFWDGKSKGTKDSINKAKSLGKEVILEYILPT